MKFKIFFYKSVNSTNDLALKKIKLGIKRGIIIAEYQSKGKGHFGKKWLSFKGNLFMSIFFQIKKNISTQKMTIMNCKIIKKILLKYFKANISIKYPNDLMINKKKFCGILQIIKFNKDIKFMIVGIGINLVKNPKIKNYPTTNILFETGIRIKKLKLIKSIENYYYSKLKLFA